MNRHIWALFAVVLMMAGCGQLPGERPPTEDGRQTTATAEASADEPRNTIETIPPATEAAVGSRASTVAPTVVPTRVGAEYVLRLPREDSVPGDWLMNPLPDFQTRQPRPGETYRFACLDLPARSTGVASVGYRSLEGLPSVQIEYVVYGSAEDAAAALDEMRAAVEACPSFTLGPGEATTATLSPMDIPAYGDASFAAALNSDNETTGALLTHLVKIRQGHVVAGISHSVAEGEAPPDDALMQALAGNVVEALSELGEE